MRTTPQPPPLDRAQLDREIEHQNRVYAQCLEALRGCDPATAITFDLDALGAEPAPAVRGAPVPAFALRA